MKWIILVCFLTAANLQGNAQDLLNQVKADYLAKDKLYDRLPSFGSSALSFADYLFENLPYPATAAADGAEGQVLIRFTVDIAGAVKDVTVLQGEQEVLVEAVVATFSRMPRWKPATRKDVPIEAQVLFLVAFNLNDDKYLTQYRSDWLLSVGIVTDRAKPKARFLLDEDRKHLPVSRPLLIQNQQPGKNVRIKENS